MAHYAKLDENNIVLGVHVVDNSQEDALGGEAETIEWLKTLWGADTIWKKTSYNTWGNKYWIENKIPGNEGPDQSKALRGNFAGKGFTYDPVKDAFIPPRPGLFPSWYLHETRHIYLPPVEAPDDGKAYDWDESTLSWILQEE